MGAIISLWSRSGDVDAGEVRARPPAISEHPLDDLLLNNGTPEAEPRWHVTITIISHEEQQPAGFGGVPASATAIAELERQEYGAMAEPRKKKRRRDSTGEASLSPATAAVSCPICLEDFVAGDGLIVMPCEHRFHGSCLTEWLKLSRFCPCCRHALPTEDDETGHVNTNAGDTSSQGSDRQAAATEALPRRSNRARQANVRLFGPEWASHSILMARSRSPVRTRGDRSLSPPNPSPEFTPRPATTHAAGANQARPATHLPSPSSLSPKARPFYPGDASAGRPKEARWRDGSPDSASSRGSPERRRPSYRDVLKTGRAAEAEQEHAARRAKEEGLMASARRTSQVRSVVVPLQGFAPSRAGRPEVGRRNHTHRFSKGQTQLVVGLPVRHDPPRRSTACRPEWDRRHEGGDRREHRGPGWQRCDGGARDGEYARRDRGRARAVDPGRGGSGGGCHRGQAARGGEVGQVPVQLRILSSPAAAVDEDGWQMVRHRRRQRHSPGGSSSARSGRSAASSRSSAGVPAELVGRCLNCFSWNHLKATCRLPPRCRRCFRFRHVAKDCKRPRVHTGGDRRFVKQRTGSRTPPASMAPSRTPSPEAGRGRPRTRHAESTGAGNGKAPATEGDGGRASSPPPTQGERGRQEPDAAVSQQDNAPVDQAAAFRDRAANPGHHSLRPACEPCFIDRDEEINNAENRLRYALLAQAGNRDLDISVATARSAVSSHLGVEVFEIEVVPYHPENFLIRFSNQQLRDEALSGGGVPVMGTTLVLRPWTRLVRAEQETLYSRVSIELDNVPLHAWSKKTAQKVLSSSCWVEKLDPTTEAMTDLSTFKLTAWTTDPSSIPTSKLLQIPEPEMTTVHSDPTMQAIFANLPCYLRQKKILYYNIIVHLRSIADFDARSSSAEGGSPPSSDGDSGPDGDPQRSYGDIPGGGPKTRGFRCTHGVMDASDKPQADNCLPEKEGAKERGNRQGREQNTLPEEKGGKQKVTTESSVPRDQLAHALTSVVPAHKEDNSTAANGQEKELSDSYASEEGRIVVTRYKEKEGKGLATEAVSVGKQLPTRHPGIEAKSDPMRIELEAGVSNLPPLAPPVSSEQDKKGGAQTEERQGLENSTPCVSMGETEPSEEAREQGDHLTNEMGHPEQTPRDQSTQITPSHGKENEDPKEAQARLEAFTAKVQTKIRTPLISKPKRGAQQTVAEVPEQAEASLSMGSIIKRSKRIAQQPLAGVASSKRAEVLLMRRMGNIKENEKPSEQAKKDLNDFFSKGLKEEHVAALRGAHPSNLLPSMALAAEEETV
ncbi:hypothetical protein EJB05_29506, partial [Eragrostis curvula]